jgi:arylsulfatase A-like enzyme
MAQSPNILFLLTDQMQARVLEDGHLCQAPNFRKLMARGVRVRNAYSPNPVCSPARASLMTGRLPHSHGVLQVTHCVDEDQCQLRADLPHWSQRLEQRGYHTGYFGKWHVEHSEDPSNFGWRSVGCWPNGDSWCQASGQNGKGKPALVDKHDIAEPHGYPPHVLYGVTDVPVAQRMMGIATGLARKFLEEVIDQPKPWCCVVSIVEPHDPFVCSKASYQRYNLDDIVLPDNVADDLADKPGLYRKAARAFRHLTDRQKRQAMACYYGLISEIDEQFGTLLDLLEKRGKLDDTVIVLTSDHGELLGAHGLFMKNTGAFEEVYGIPMVVAGPGIARGKTVDARVGLHDLCPTLCELAGADPIDTRGESRSFAPLLRDPAGEAASFQDGYAEYFGTRYWLTQRVFWDGSWKLVFNGFDEDELYDLASDPGERRNLARDPAHAARYTQMMAKVWARMRQVNDRPLLDAKYLALRYAVVGPDH